MTGDAACRSSEHFHGQASRLQDVGGIGRVGSIFILKRLAILGGQPRAWDRTCRTCDGPPYMYRKITLLALAASAMAAARRGQVSVGGFVGVGASSREPEQFSDKEPTAPPRRSAGEGPTSRGASGCLSVFAASKCHGRFADQWTKMNLSS